MKFDELRSLLAENPRKLARFILPDGEHVPIHFHLTEVGHVAKNFIDCGGTIRKTESCVLQLWVNNADKDHRLDAGKLANILALAERVLPTTDLGVEVEYDDYAISQFPITSFRTSEDYLDFALTTKHTDCLAKQKCGVENEDSCCGETAASSCCRG
jgi:uncharacterized protein DUF6428